MKFIASMFSLNCVPTLLLYYFMNFSLHFFFIFPTPQICASVDTHNWFLLIVINIIAFQCTCSSILKETQQQTSNKTKTNQQVMWSMSSLGNSIQIGLLHSLGILLFYFYCGAVEKGRIDTKAHTRTPQSTTHIFNGFWFGKEERTELKSSNAP